MIASIHQPNYLPWLGYFYKIARSDIFVLLDDVQYSKNGFINRNRIKTAQGALWLTVGVITKGQSGQLINEVMINNAIPWSSRHQKSISQSYSKAPYYNNYISVIHDIYRRKWERLADLNEAFIKLFCLVIGIHDVEFVRASELGVPGHGTELLVNICRAVQAETYLSGPSGHEYLEEGAFGKAGIDLQYSDFVHPIYTQIGDDFLPDLSVIDLLFNEGERSLDILTRKTDD